MPLGLADSPRTLLREIYGRGPLSRSDLAKATGLTGAAISRITRDLVDKGILQEGDKLAATGKLGPKFVALTFGADRYVVGIGVQAVSQWVELADLQGRIVGRRTFAMASVSNADAVLHQCAESVEEILAEAGIPKSKVIGVGLSVVGVVDIHSGTVLRAENLGWNNVPVVRKLTEALGLPVYAESFLNSLMLASSGLSVLDGDRNSLLVVVSLGIGASILLNGGLLDFSAKSDGSTDERWRGFWRFVTRKCLSDNGFLLVLQSGCSPHQCWVDFSRWCLFSPQFATAGSAPRSAPVGSGRRRAG